MEINAGDKLFYSNKRENKVIECKVLRVELGFPLRVILESKEDGRRFHAYPSFDCFETIEDAKEELLEPNSKPIY